MLSEIKDIRDDFIVPREGNAALKMSLSGIDAERGNTLSFLLSQIERVQATDPPRGKRLRERRKP